MTSLAEFLQ